jgi:hypothetical protein
MRLPNLMHTSLEGGLTPERLAEGGEPTASRWSSAHASTRESAQITRDRTSTVDYLKENPVPERPVLTPRPRSAAVASVIGSSARRVTISIADSAGASPDSNDKAELTIVADVNGIQASA